MFILSLYWYSTLSTASLVIFLVILLCVGITQNGPYSLASACMPSAINRMQTGRNEKLVGMATGEDVFLSKLLLNLLLFYYHFYIIPSCKF